MARINSRRKGVVGEREAAAWWRARGFDKCQRGQQHRGGPDSPDICNLPGLHVEVKRQNSLGRFYGWLAQSERETRMDEIPIVMAREDTERPGQAKPPWLIILTAESFHRLYAAWLGQSGKTYSEHGETEAHN